MMSPRTRKLFFAMLATFIMLIVLIMPSMWSKSWREFISLDNITIFNFLFIISAIYFLMYLVLHLNAKFQTQRDISQLYDLLPDLKSRKQRAKDVEHLSEEISVITMDKTQEIDLLIEKENYRREFVGNVAHELKTPLFSIQGFVLTLIDGAVEDVKIRDAYLKRINKSVERLTNIVKDLDLITNLEAGNLKLDVTEFDIVELTQDVYDLLEKKAEKNLVFLMFNKIYEEPIMVKGDAEKLEQVMINLISNAINHSQRESVVTTSFEVLEDKVKILVEDTGMGIDPDKINRIFERFYRAETSRSRQQGGSGLGLAIVKHILEAHHQKIYVESKIGEGARFYFYLNKP